MIVLRIDNRAHLSPLSEIPGQVATQIKDRLTFANPAYQEAEKRGYWTGNIEQEIVGYQVEGDALVIPRGFTRQLVGILRGAGIRYQVEDRRRAVAPVDFTFLGELHDFQVEAVDAMAARDFGTLSSPTGSGKTVMALKLIELRKQPALVICHTKELMDQWVVRIETFLGIPAGQVGRIGGGKMKVGDKITVALVQSLYKVAHDVTPHVGHLVVDECHRAPSRTFTECVTAFCCRYMLGLSATPYRRDQLTRLIWWHIGDKVHEVDKEALVDAGHILQPEVVYRETAFAPYHDPSTEYSKVLSELTQDPARNSLIVDDIVREAQGNGGGVCLVLSDRKAHCEALQALLRHQGIEAHLANRGYGERGQARGCGGPGRRRRQGAGGQRTAYRRRV